MAAVIRVAREADGEAVGAIYAPFVTGSVVSFELTPPSAAEMAERIRATLATHPWLVCEIDGAVAGYAYAGRHRQRAAYQWSTETSAYVGDGYRRRGVARALYDALLAVLRLQGFVNAYAGITLPNPASEGFHAACGFELVGVYRSVGFKFGQWHDVAWSALQLQERVANPPPPRTFVELIGTPELDAALAVGKLGM